MKSIKHYKTISNHHTNAVKFDNLANTVNPLINIWGVYVISRISEETSIRRQCLKEGSVY